MWKKPTGSGQKNVRDILAKWFKKSALGESSKEKILGNNAQKLLTFEKK